MLSSLQALLEVLKTDPKTKRYQQLEHIIDQDKTLQKDHELLKELQKKMVRAEANNSTQLSQYKEEYNNQLEKIKNHILLSEYVDLTESINNDLQLIQNIISEEINMDID